jgi:hypothetical protein
MKIDDTPMPRHNQRGIIDPMHTEGQSFGDERTIQQTGTPGIEGEHGKMNRAVSLQQRFF